MRGLKVGTRGRLGTRVVPDHGGDEHVHLQAGFRGVQGEDLPLPGSISEQQRAGEAGASCNAGEVWLGDPAYAISQPACAGSRRDSLARYTRGGTSANYARAVSWRDYSRSDAQRSFSRSVSYREQQQYFLQKASPPSAYPTRVASHRATQQTTSETGHSRAASPREQDTSGVSHVRLIGQRNLETVQSADSSRNRKSSSDATQPTQGDQSPQRIKLGEAPLNRGNVHPSRKLSAKFSQKYGTQLPRLNISSVQFAGAVRSEESLQEPYPTQNSVRLSGKRPSTKPANVSSVAPVQEEQQRQSWRSKTDSLGFLPTNFNELEDFAQETSTLPMSESHAVHQNDVGLSRYSDPAAHVAKQHQSEEQHSELSHIPVRVAVASTESGLEVGINRCRTSAGACAGHETVSSFGLFVGKRSSDLGGSFQSDTESACSEGDGTERFPDSPECGRDNSPSVDVQLTLQQWQRAAVGGGSIASSPSRAWVHSSERFGGLRKCEQLSGERNAGGFPPKVESPKRVSVLSLRHDSALVAQYGQVSLQHRAEQWLARHVSVIRRQRTKSSGDWSVRSSPRTDIQPERVRRSSSASQIGEMVQPSVRNAQEVESRGGVQLSQQEVVKTRLQMAEEEWSTGRGSSHSASDIDATWKNISGDVPANGGADVRASYGSNVRSHPLPPSTLRSIAPRGINESTEMDHSRKSGRKLQELSPWLTSQQESDAGGGPDAAERDAAANDVILLPRGRAAARGASGYEKAESRYTWGANMVCAQSQGRGSTTKEKRQQHLHPRNMLQMTSSADDKWQAAAAMHDREANDKQFSEVRSREAVQKGTAAMMRADRTHGRSSFRLEFARKRSQPGNDDQASIHDLSQGMPPLPLFHGIQEYSSRALHRATYHFRKSSLYSLHGQTFQKFSPRFATSKYFQLQADQVPRGSVKVSPRANLSQSSDLSSPAFVPFNVRFSEEDWCSAYVPEVITCMSVPEVLPDYAEYPTARDPNQTVRNYHRWSTGQVPYIPIVNAPTLPWEASETRQNQHYIPPGRPTSRRRKAAGGEVQKSGAVALEKEAPKDPHFWLKASTERRGAAQGMVVNAEMGISDVPAAEMGNGASRPDVSVKPQSRVEQKGYLREQQTVIPGEHFFGVSHKTREIQSQSQTLTRTSVSPHQSETHIRADEISVTNRKPRASRSSDEEILSLDSLEETSFVYHNTPQPTPEALPNTKDTQTQVPSPTEATTPPSPQRVTPPTNPERTSYRALVRQTSTSLRRAAAAKARMEQGEVRQLTRVGSQGRQVITSRGLGRRLDRAMSENLAYQRQKAANAAVAEYSSKTLSTLRRLSLMSNSPELGRLLPAVSEPTLPTLVELSDTQELDLGKGRQTESYGEGPFVEQPDLRQRQASDTTVTGKHGKAPHAEYTALVEDYKSFTQQRRTSTGLSRGRHGPSAEQQSVSQVSAQIEALEQLGERLFVPRQLQRNHSELVASDRNPQQRSRSANFPYEVPGLNPPALQGSPPPTKGPPTRTSSSAYARSLSVSGPEHLRELKSIAQHAKSRIDTGRSLARAGSKQSRAPRASQTSTTDVAVRKASLLNGKRASVDTRYNQGGTKTQKQQPRPLSADIEPPPRASSPAKAAPAAPQNPPQSQLTRATRTPTAKSPTAISRSPPSAKHASSIQPVRATSTAKPASTVGPRQTPQNSARTPPKKSPAKPKPAQHARSSTNEMSPTSAVSGSLSPRAVPSLPSRVQRTPSTPPAKRAQSVANVAANQTQNLSPSAGIKQRGVSSSREASPTHEEVVPSKSKGLPSQDARGGYILARGRVGQVRVARGNRGRGKAGL